MYFAVQIFPASFFWITRFAKCKFSTKYFMPMFTFIIEYDGGTYISQRAAATPRAALQRWLRSFDFSIIPRLDSQTIQTLRKYLATETLTPVTSVQNVWCITCTTPRKLFLVNLIKTRAR
jgi:hypothetical protein